MTALLILAIVCAVLLAPSLLAGRPLALRPLAVRHANKAARSSQRADAFDVGGHAGGAGCDCQDDKGAGMIDLMDWWDWAVGVMLAWLLAWRWS